MKFVKFLDSIDKTLACPNKFLAAMKSVCIIMVCCCINFGALGCSEESKASYNPFGETSAESAVSLDSMKSDLSSSGIGSSSVISDVDTPVVKKVKDFSEDKITVIPVEKEVEDTVPKKIVDVPSPTHKNPTTISTSQKINKNKKDGGAQSVQTKSGDVFRYNLPCVKKVQIKKGMTAYALCKKHGIDYAELVAINKPGIVANFKIGNWVCLKRKE